MLFYPVYVPLGGRSASRTGVNQLAGLKLAKLGSETFNTMMVSPRGCGSSRHVCMCAQVNILTEMSVHVIMSVPCCSSPSAYESAAGTCV